MLRRIAIISALLVVGSLAHADDALDLLRLTVKAEQNISFRGERITVFPASGHAPVSELVVRDGTRFRSMVQQPMQLKGLLVIDDGRQLMVVKPGATTATVQPSRQGELARMTRNLVKSVSEGHMQAQITGTEKVAGRQCSVVQLQSFGYVSHRLWIDSETKIPLKQAEYQGYGVPRYVQSFIWIVSPTQVSVFTFALPPNVKVKNERSNQSSNYFSTVREAQTIVDFIIQTPKRLPAGYRLVGVRVRPFMGRVFVSQHFSNNQVNITLFQTTMKSGSGLNGFRPYDQHRWLSWKKNGLEFGILGNMPEPIMNQIYRAMQ